MGARCHGFARGPRDSVSAGRARVGRCVQALMVHAFGHSCPYNTPAVVTRQTQAPKDRAWVEVILANLAANAETVRAAARGARLLPMVKADGYGLGAIPVTRT